MNKFEQLLDLIVNEEKDKAEELFHEIVVEKSRSIYETLIAEEEAALEAKDGEEADDEEDDDQQDESVEETFGMEEEGEEAPGFGGDETDALADKVTDHGAEDGEMDGEEDGEEAPATKGDVQDLEDALEELKAEFEKLMAGEEHEEEHDSEFGDEEADDADDSNDADDSEEDSEGYEFAEGRETVREYTENIGAAYKGGAAASTRETGASNTKSPANQNPANRPSGGNVSAHNIAQGDQGGEGIKGGEGLVGGVKGKFTSPNTHNVDGVKSGIKTLDKKGEAYKGGNVASTSETGAGNTKSVVDKKQG